MEGTAARRRRIEELLPLVHALARRHAHRGEPLEDLVQAGALGAIGAVDRFDPARGIPLAAYAAPSIEGAIRHHLRDGCATVRVPRRLLQQAAAAHAAQHALAATGRAPTTRDVAQVAGLSEADLAHALAAEQARAPAPLPGPDGDGGEPWAAAADDRLALAAALAMLSPRERRILALRYFDELSQAQIATRVGLSQVHVSRLLRAALAQLRVSMEPLPAPPPLPRAAATA